MNIAFFSKQLPSDEPNGVSVQVHRLAVALAGRGHRVVCFSFSACSPDMPYEVRTLPWSGNSRLSRKFQPAAAFSKIKTGAYDVAHYHGDDWLCAGSRKRVRTFYGSALFEALHARAPGRFFYQALFYKLEWISCLRRGALTGISAATQRALPLVRRVIPCGVPLDRFLPDRTQKTAFPSILFLGDFSSRKRGDLLLRTFQSQVLPEHPECRLTIVGPESVAAPNVRCLGRIDEAALIREYRKAWICCLPGSYEGFGVPAVEAMACGTTVVATVNAGVSEIVETGKNGILCAQNSLGDSILRVIKDDSFRNGLVAGGVIKAGEFDINATAQRYEDIYFTLADR